MKRRLVILALLVGIGPLAAGNQDSEAAPDRATTPMERFYEPWTDSPPGTEEARSEILVRIKRLARPEVLPRWCLESRRRVGEDKLATALLRGGGDYRPFTGSGVPLELELLIDDLEVRYVMGVPKPPGVEGNRPPFIEICPVGLGARSGEGWSHEVIQFTNRQGAQLAVGFYEGVLPTAEREALETTLGFPTSRPDPAGVLLVGDEEEGQAIILIESQDTDRHLELRSEILSECE